MSVTSTRNLHFSSGYQNSKVDPTALSKEYPVVDHTFDAVVVGAGKSIIYYYYSFYIVFQKGIYTRKYTGVT